jgi:DNA-binding MarR family transcriptional regulator
MTKTLVTEDDFSRCMLLNTVHTARALLRRYDQRLKPLGVTVVQFSIMAMIRNNPGRSIHGLAERIATDRSTLTRNIDLLVRNGLVVKESAAKGNAKICRLTEEGGELLDRLIPLWRDAQREMQDLMKGRDPDAYLTTLRLLARG